MDDLTAQLATSFQVTHNPNSTAAQHPRFSDYKARATGLADQEKRRKSILLFQKNKRYNYQNHVRRLAENDWADLSEDEDDVQAEAMDVQNNKPKFRRPGRNYRDQLMLSEWMIEVPQNFETDWVLVPCPVGKRNLVVASSGMTHAYSKGGWCIAEFLSRLPGGSKSVPKWNAESTILDTIFNEVTQTFYVLDIMCWKQQPLYDTETEFRFYWMQDKFSEHPELKKTSKTNKYSFEVLPNFRCDKQNVTDVLSTKMNVDLDGLLFYHKKTFYTFGSTPLVTWLKAYMVPDILHCEVPSHFVALKPKTYSTFENHVEQVKVEKLKEEEKQAKQEEKRKGRFRKIKGGGEMDTSSVGSGQTHQDMGQTVTGVNMDSGSNAQGSLETLNTGASVAVNPEYNDSKTSTKSTIRPVLGCRQ